MSEWRVSQSAERPLAVDKELCEGFVYLRRSITEEDVTNEDETTTHFYNYEEKVLTTTEYQGEQLDALQAFVEMEAE